jgi:4-amino-4-deoxy-L-arabinose transferase-like glycosyltransferase
MTDTTSVLTPGSETNQARPPDPGRAVPVGVPTRRTLLALGAFALSVRLAYRAIFLRHYKPDSDALQYGDLAKAIAHGRGLSDIFPFWFAHPSAFRPPLYPLLLGVVYRLSGDRLLVGMLTNAVIGSAVVVLVALLGARVGGTRTALAAGMVAALAPSLLFNDGVTLSEPLSLLLMLGAMLLLLDGRDLGAAVATALLMLTRPSAQALVLVLAVWMLRSFGWRRALRFVLVVAAVVAPWIGRNVVELGSPTLVTSNGFNLAASYSPLALANYGFVDPFGAPQLQGLRYQHFTEPDIDKTLRSYAVQQIRQHPHAIIWHVKQNLRSWMELNQHQTDIAERLDGRPIGFLHATLPFFFATFVLGVAGLWLSRRRAATRLMVLVAAYFWVTSAVTTTAPRLRAPIDVIVYVGAGVAIVALTRRFAHATGDASVSHRDADVVTARPIDRRRNRVLLVGLAGALVAVVGITITARLRIEHDAGRSARMLAIQARPAIDLLASRFPVAPAAQRPVIDVGAISDRLYTLDGELWKLVPQVSPKDEPIVRAAAERLYDASVPTRLLVLIMLQTTARQPHSWTFAEVQATYETRRAANSTLPTWSALLAGTSINQARQAILTLSR